MADNATFDLSQINGFNADPNTGTLSQMDPSNPMYKILQQAQSQGAIGEGAADWSQLSGLLPKTDMGSPNQDFGIVDNVKDSQHIKYDDSGNPMIDVESYNNSHSQAWSGDPHNVKWNDDYGWITPNSNLRRNQKDDLIDKIDNMAPGLIMAGLTGGMGMLGAPAALMGLPGTVGNIAGNGSSPLGLLGSGLNLFGGSLGIPPQVGQMMNLAGTAMGAINNPTGTAINAGLKYGLPQIAKYMNLGD